MAEVESEMNEDDEEENNEDLYSSVEESDDDSDAAEADENDASGSDDSGSSLSSESETSCPICLNRLRDQLLGTPEACDHLFCLTCIEEWARNTNTCPIDRQNFQLIMVKQNGQIIRRIPVESKALNSDDEDAGRCQICSRSDREDQMLLCDGCDLGFHMDCLDPPLTQIPSDEWFCPECAPEAEANQLANDPNYGADGVAPEIAPPPRRRQPVRRRQTRRTIPRTQLTERVRLRIAAVIEAVTQRINDEVEDSASLYSLLTANRKAPVRRRARRKRRRRGSRRRKTKRTKRKRIYSRAAENSPKKQMKRIQKRAEGISSTSRPSLNSTTSSLSIFGRHDELLHFSDESDVEDVRWPRLSTRAQLFNQPIRRKLNLNRPDNPTNGDAPSTSQASTSSSSIDLLDNIMQGQQLLLTPSNRKTIQRDGKIVLAKGTQKFLPPKKLPNESTEVKNVNDVESSLTTPISSTTLSTPRSPTALSTPISPTTLSTPISPTTLSTPRSPTTLSTPINPTTLSSITSSPFESNSETNSKPVVENGIFSFSPPVESNSEKKFKPTVANGIYVFSPPRSPLTDPENGQEVQQKHKEKLPVFSEKPKPEKEKEKNPEQSDDHTEIDMEIANEMDESASGTSPSPSGSGHKKSPGVPDVEKSPNFNQGDENLQEIKRQKAFQKYAQLDLKESAAQKLRHKINLQLEVEAIVKEILKPYFQRKIIDKDQYKSLMKKIVPKVCKKSKMTVDAGKIQRFVEEYVQATVKPKMRRNAKQY